ncbi:MAG: hypothetical protein AAFQ08_02090, partial [Bacteroidota bacterium]
MSEYLAELKALLQQHFWFIRPLFILWVAIMLTYVCYLLHRRIQPKLTTNRRFVISAFLQALYAPLVISIWVQAIFAITRSIADKLDDSFVSIVDTIREISLILLIAWVCIR